ncbi:MAG: YfiR family protein [Bacteroidales bacterium]|nr:YfiR family protein [Bacteroidales bacterium]
MSQLKKIIVYLILNLLTIISIYSQDVMVVEAVFLEKFTRFVTWPADSNVYDTTTPFVIGVIGDDPIGEVLRDVYSQFTILKKDVQIKSIIIMDEVSSCDMIFIGEVEKHVFEELLELLEDKPILLVSHNKGFAEEGVHINFVMLGDKLRFEINHKSLSRSGLKASHLLLRQAIII